MDNLQFWIYVAFGVIYFITRVMKKKPKAPNPNQESPLEPGEEVGRQPASFEELLQEITQKRPEKMRPVEAAEEFDQPAEEMEVSRPVDHSGEGRTRHFADDESRAIYERSIQEAEKEPEIEPVPESQYKINIKSRSEEVEYTSDIHDLLSDADSAKKAVILSEILTRKY